MRHALVVEDDVFAATLLSESLTAHDFVVEVAANAEQAHKVLSWYEPDVALIDLHLGSGPSGFDVAHYVAELHPETAILAMTKYETPEFIGQGQNSLPSHAAFIPKDRISSIDDLLGAINAAITGTGRNAHNQFMSDSPLSNLTKTQVKVLRLLAQGYRTSEIAAKRNSSENAVEQLISAIYRALKIKSDPVINPRTEAVRIYIENAGLPARPKPE